MKIESLKHLQQERKNNCWTIIIQKSYVKVYNTNKRRYDMIYDGLEMFLGRFKSDTIKRIEINLQSHRESESVKFNIKSIEKIMYLKRKPTLNQLYSIKQYCTYNIDDLKIKLIL